MSVITPTYELITPRDFGPANTEFGLSTTEPDAAVATIIDVYIITRLYTAMATISVFWNALISINVPSRTHVPSDYTYVVPRLHQ